VPCIGVARDDGKLRIGAASSVRHSHERAASLEVGVALHNNSLLQCAIRATNANEPVGIKHSK
jgi:hypothetical protein